MGKKVRNFNLFADLGYYALRCVFYTWYSRKLVIMIAMGIRNTDFLYGGLVYGCVYNGFESTIGRVDYRNTQCDSVKYG
jgi:hypothetical protein